MKNIKMNCLYKINKVTKIFGYLKKSAYSRGDHQEVQKYKTTQRQLYLLKGLTICQLIDSGELLSGQRMIDGYGTYLHTFSDTDEVYSFHSISVKQEPDGSEPLTSFGEAEERTLKTKNATYLPYVYYLVQALTPAYRAVYDAITENNFQFNFRSSDIPIFELLNNAGIRAEITSTSWLGNCDYTYHVELSSRGAKICEVTMSQWEDVDYDLECYDGILSVEECSFN